MVAAAIACATAARGPAAAAHYRRTVEDSAKWEGSRFIRTPLTGVTAPTDAITFDDATGMLRLGGSALDGYQTKIIQRHTDQNDLVAIRDGKGIPNPNTEVFRVRGWDRHQGLNFLYIDTWTMYAGPCTLTPWCRSPRIRGPYSMPKRALVSTNGLLWGIRPVIPSKADQPVQPGFDRPLYRERIRVERLVNRLKRWRKIATRYKKRALYYAAFVTLPASESDCSFENRP